MASKTYKTSAIVLKKTRLGDKDLIVAMLDVSGALRQGVAKGARKPGGSFSARLELFSTVDVLMAKGRNLDVVCDARLVASSLAPNAPLELTACASPIAELCYLAAQPDLPQARLFDMVRSAFSHVAACAEKPERAIAVTAASLWKVASQLGYRPAIARCALCAKEAGDLAEARSIPFSPAEGGVVCASCSRPADAVVVDTGVLRWCETLIRSRFDDIVSDCPDLSTTFALLELANLWVRTHVGRGLKSLDFLFTSGLF